MKNARNQLQLIVLIREGQMMAVTVGGFVKNGVVVPNAPLPEGAQVEIRLSERAASVVARLYANVRAPVIFTDIVTACLVKYVCNVFHALKVAFANEVGHLSEALNVDGRRLMEIVCQDTKLNIAPTYLTPGFAFGKTATSTSQARFVFEAGVLF